MDAKLAMLGQDTLPFDNQQLNVSYQRSSAFSQYGGDLTPKPKDRYGHVKSKLESPTISSRLKRVNMESSQPVTRKRKVSLEEQ